MTRYALSLSLALLATPVLAQTETKTVSGADVAIYNLVGRMRAVAGAGNAVSVEIRRGGPDASKLRVETGTIRNRQTLRVIYPADRIVYPDMRGSRVDISVREDGTFSDGSSWNEFRDMDRTYIRSSGSGFEAYADLVVSVPKGQRIALYLAAGRVDVSNVDGDILIDVASADVDVNGTKGPLSLDTGSGRVSVRDVTGDVSVDAGSGGITLGRVKGNVLTLDSGSGSVDASEIEVKDFKADVGSGGVRVSKLSAATVSVETGSGSASIELIGAVERMDVESGSGGVTLRAPANLSAEIDAETGSGGFQTDFDILTRRLSRNHVQGKIGDGKGRVRLESGSGTIRLLKN
jgi:lia operon protein LiaG